MKEGWTFESAALHWWAVFIAGVTFILLCSGGLVTSHGAGLAVPDWPNTFGYNMFTFPISRWVSGIFFEHSHRLIGTFVGSITAILAVWLWLREAPAGQKAWGVAAIVSVVALLGIREMPVYIGLAILAPLTVGVAVYFFKKEGGLRWLGIAALAAVVLQGVLGGLRVVWLTDEIGIFHALLAQSFFVFISLLAIATSRRFVEKRWADYAPNLTLRNLVFGTSLLIFFQLGLGATMRHEHIGLSIPDFPMAYGRVLPDTSPAALEKINEIRERESQMPTTALQIWIQMAHRFVAVLILGGVFVAFLQAQQLAPRAVRVWTTCWLVMIFAQVCLGAWTIWSNKAADIATVHMALGALSLLVGSILSFRLFCGARTQDFVLPDGVEPSLMKRTV